MAPEELKAYLDVIRSSGLTFGRLEVVGKLVVDSVGGGPGGTSAHADEHPVMRDLRELFPGGMRPGGVG